ncbi:MAG: 16S rRNA (uracil(1498)-N(3))-methyltransferase, partial [Oscillospiraceae bacterium]|nr:16S rRNA (uracil(1498)-N(3))-methyltransferase [Oscillospiraceae bacterium]
MPKFFVPAGNIREDGIIITGGDVAHIKKVLRLKEGDSLVLCDSAGFDYDAVISEFNDNSIVCRIRNKIKSDTEPNINVTLFQGIPKASKMDYIIQKTTELGISRIVPCITERCVVKINAGNSDKKIERWQKVAEEAAKQSGRG